MILGGRENYIPATIISMEAVNLIFHGFLPLLFSERYSESFQFQTKIHKAIWLTSILTLALAYRAIMEPTIQLNEELISSKKENIDKVRAQCLTILEEFIDRDPHTASAQIIIDRIIGQFCFSEKLKNKTIEQQFNITPIIAFGIPKSSVAERISKIPSYSQSFFNLWPSRKASITQEITAKGEDKHYGCMQRFWKYFAPKTDELERELLSQNKDPVEPNVRGLHD